MIIKQKDNYLTMDTLAIEKMEQCYGLIDELDILSSAFCQEIFCGQVDCDTCPIGILRRATLGLQTIAQHAVKGGDNYDIRKVNPNAFEIKLYQEDEE